jgi:hypothetical protein
MLTGARSCVRSECAVFFEFLRNSLRDIESELLKRNEREARLTSDCFWRDFIAKAPQVRQSRADLMGFQRDAVVLAHPDWRCPSA